MHYSAIPYIYIMLHAANPDIKNREDIQLLVDTFYDKLSKDELLKDIFFNRLGHGDWQHHLDTIYNFWESVLFQQPTYKGQSFLPHFTLNLYQYHFDQWLKLFGESIDEHFAGEVAEDAKKKANTMAILFMSKINHYREHGGTPLM